MAEQEHQTTTPVGRMVGGSLYRPKTTNSKGEPLVYKTGAKKGQPRPDFSFGVAYPKTPGVQHWASEPWLQPVWALAHAAFPQGQANHPTFSFKITDGDSQVPNKNMRRPCDQEGYPGHWVIWFSSTQAPKVTNADGSTYIHEQDAVKPGYYVQVFCSVTDNKPSETPGLYWNPFYVALAGYGPEIMGGPELAQAKFGQGVALPAGASSTPLAAAGVPAPVPGVPMPPPVPMAPPPVPNPGSVPVAPPAVPTAPVPVSPNPAFTQMVPPPPAAPAVPVPPPVAGPQPTALAGGRSLAELLAMPGWNLDLLKQHGYVA